MTTQPSTTSVIPATFSSSDGSAPYDETEFYTEMGMNTRHAAVLDASVQTFGFRTGDGAFVANPAWLLATSDLALGRIIFQKISAQFAAQVVQSS